MIFEKSGALYGPPTPGVIERVRFAVIKLAMQGSENLEMAETLYCTDTRDLLVCAGFANRLDAHEIWCKSVLD